MKMAHLKLVAVVALAFLVTACAGPNTAVDTMSPSGGIAGFWSGIFHGAFITFTFVISLFSESVSIYEVHNNGTWYNFGFLLGIILNFVIFD